jgi:energy-coupling factor transport system substrate-specific component
MPAPTSAPGTTDPATTTTPTRRISRFTLKDLVLIVVLGVVFGFLYWALVQAWTGLAILLGPAGEPSAHDGDGDGRHEQPAAEQHVLGEVAGVIAEVLASVIEVVFLGSAVGPILIASAAIQGAGSELPFALRRYSSFGWGSYALSGLLGSGFVFIFSAFRFGWYGQDLFFLRLAIQLASGVILGGLLAKVIVDALAKTGVVDNFAIGRALHAQARG